MQQMVSRTAVLGEHGTGLARHLPYTHVVVYEDSHKPNNAGHKQMNARLSVCAVRNPSPRSDCGLNPGVQYAKRQGICVD
jgi:hypothetical protein